jgi:uncharacterized membrane protein
MSMTMNHADPSSTPGTSTDAKHSRRRAVMTGLALVGLLVCAYLEVMHVQTYLGLGGTGYCEAGERISCSNVALSGASVLLGVPLPIVGVAGFLAIALAASRSSKLLLPLTVVAAAASVGLLVYELVEVGAICMWCEVVHVICFALLALAWLERRQAGSSAAGQPDSATITRSLAVELGPSAALVLATAVFAPAYWMAASWSSGARLPHGVDEQGRPWLGSEQPDLVIHEYIDYACPHCRLASSRMKMRLADDKDLRIIRHHQPRMRCTTATSETPAPRCYQARIAICAGEQGLFWEMDDWLFLHPALPSKLDLEQAAQDVGLDLGALQTCMESPETYARAQVDVDEAREHGIRGTPGYVVDGKRLEPDQLQQLLNDR